MIINRSFDTPSGNTATKRTPRAAHAMANAIDVEPLDASTTVVPAWTRPVSTPRRSTWAASRSFVDPLGSWYSSLSQMVQPDTGSSSATVGVVASTSGVRRSGSKSKGRGTERHPSARPAPNERASASISASVPCAVISS